MNSYCSLAELKTRLNINDTDDDTTLRILLEAASRAIDKDTQRYFYIEIATKYYPGATKLFIDDLLSIDTDGFKLDAGGDGVFEITLETTDYFLKPFNKYPKTMIDINPSGSHISFADGIPRGVEIAGTWGYAESTTPYVSSGITITADNGTEIELDVSAEGTIVAGHTILVESEQMYVKSATADDTKKITVKRGVNGTTAAAHSSKTAYIYEYPEVVRESCLIMASRLWKRKDTAFGTTLGAPEIGTVEVFHGMDPDVKILLASFKKVLI